MEIKHIIVHAISKNKHQKREAIELSLRDQELPLAEKVVTLIENIREVYTNKTGKAYGQLNEHRNFSKELSNWFSSKVEFVKFSKDQMEEFKGHLSSQPLATGGYLLFTNYISNGKNYFMVVMLKSKDGVSFDDELELMDATHLDLDKLHFAARVDLEGWKDADDGNDVSFIKGRASETVTTYFKEFLGISEFSESALTTRDLVVAVNNYYRKELKLPAEEVEVHKKLVHDYCLVKSEKEEKVFLEELSRYLDGDNPEGFLIYAQEKYEIPNEFQVDKLKLRKFLKYSGKDNSISISFSSEVFGTRVKYDANSDVMTIKGIPNSLRELLMSELKEKKEA